MMSEDNAPWAVTMLTVASDTLSVDEVAAKLGPPTPEKKPQRDWSRTFQADDASLTSQFEEVERFLAEKVDALEELAPACEKIWLLCGWTPKRGQDHLLVSPKLASLLGRIGANITIDTWTDDSDDDGSTEPASKPAQPSSAGLDARDVTEHPPP